MNGALDPHIAAAKVIAAGSISDDWLRATIMLAPIYPAESAGLLESWPSQMIKWLRLKNFRLRLLVEPVRYASAGNGCVTLPQGEIQFVDVEASAVKTTWEGNRDARWVDQLWAEAFDAKKDPQTWSLLAKTITAAASTSSKGGAFAKGNNGMAGSGKNFPTIRAENLRKEPVSGNTKTAALDWILPSRQAELSLLLEYKRALELCDSAVHAFDKHPTVLSKEIDCSLIAQRKPGDSEPIAPSLELKDLFESAHAQFQDAYKSAQSLYSAEPCEPASVKATATSDAGRLGQADRRELEEALHRPLDSYQAANQPQQYAGGGDNPHTPEDALSQVFYSLQASPTLSRLFGLAIDVRLRRNSLDEMLRDHPKLADGGYFLCLGLEDGSLCRNALACTIYTLAKYRPGPSPQHFWPASRAEVALGLSPDSKRLFDLAQYDGVMLGGRRLSTATGFVSRFELSSLDVHSACEAALDRRTVNLTTEELKQQCLSGSPALRPAAIARKTYSTAGLVILDRGRQQQAVSQFAARIAHQTNMSSKPMVLDAEDLTIGYRIDVGVPLRGEKPNYAWRSLMARNVKYGIKGLHSRHVRAVAEILFLENTARAPVAPDLSWRQCLEDGLLALPARLIPRTDDINLNDGTVDAYVEEAIGTWAGEPMSVPCAGRRTEKVKPLYGLPSGCVVSPPTKKKDPQRRAPALRFGWPYRVGLRPVYSGGISVPLEVAANLYDQDRTAEFPLGGSLTIPAVPAIPRTEGAQQQSAHLPIRRRDQLRRFLRHERIDAPFLLLPEELALRRNGPMGYERAAHAIIRTVHSSVRDRERPIVTQRVFVAPTVSQSFAAMHGVFDKTHDQHPAQGLSSVRFGRYGVRFDAEKGGFPVVTSDHIVGFNGVPYVSSRRVSTHTHGEKPDIGDLVYSTAQPRASRESPYYPDPAINAYVIGIRVAGSSTYLEGGPCVISAYGKGYQYPDTRPLVITIQRAPAKQRRSACPKLEQVLWWPKSDSNERVSGHLSDGSRIPGSVEALLSLAPGDDFEIDVWCVPDDIGLTKRFALIESIGSLAIARARSKQGDNHPPNREQVCDALKGLLPALVCEAFDKCLPDTGIAGETLRDWSEGCAGPGGLPAPGPESLRAIGRALYEALVRRPLDEIAAVRTLRATHATDQPLRHPEFVPITANDAPVASEPLLTLHRTRPSPDEPYRYSARGNVVIHLPTTGCLEVSADMASPSSDRFDDVRRARALRDRRLGTWPSLENRSPMPASRIFGFDVSPTGDVSLPKTRGVVLYRLDDIPLPQPGEPADKNQERHTIPLDKLFEIRGSCPKYGTGKPAFQFSDGLARLLDLRVTAYSRHRDQMRTASAPASNGKWLRDGAPLTSNTSSAQSSSVSAWLPAAVRPAEPAARTPVPAFLWTTDREQKRAGVKIRRVSRRIVIRIPLERPWFSSGEDERLGIVLWPPNLFTQDESRFAADQVESASKSGLNRRIMNLEDFQDEDLGPGGKFITRWGGDPTRTAASQVPYRRSFIPASAFLDASQDTGTAFKAELVTNVSMPIRVTENGVHRSNGDDGVSPTLDVSLLIFQPKFDVFEEQWYVDVVMEHEREAEPFVRFGLVRYQPHAPAHLQVSYPVTQWIQLLPRRTVEVRRSKMDVVIRVEGLAISPPPSTPKIDDERTAVPRMIAHIVREVGLESGVPTRRIVTESAFGGETITYLPGAGDAYRAVWEQTLPLNTAIDKDTGGRAKYFVIIEEREAKLPATYANEPVSPEMAIGKGCDGKFLDEVLVESGSRFLAKIPL